LWWDGCVCAVLRQAGDDAGYPPHMLGIFVTTIVNSLDIVAFFTVIMLGGAFSSGELVLPRMRLKLLRLMSQKSIDTPT